MFSSNNVPMQDYKCNKLSPKVFKKNNNNNIQCNRKSSVRARRSWKPLVVVRSSHFYWQHYLTRSPLSILPRGAIAKAVTYALADRRRIRSTPKRNWQYLVC